MAEQKYTYSIYNDFPNHRIDGSRLHQEIANSTIVTAIMHVNTNDDVCDIWFKDSLSGADQQTLNALVAAHSGDPLPQAPLPVSLAGVSATADGRLNIRNTTANTTKNYRLRVFSWQTSNPASVHNKNALFVDYGDVTIMMLDANDLVTADPNQCVKEYVDFEPAYNYDIIGGWTDIPENVRAAGPGSWYMSALAVPDVPRSMGGSIEFISSVDLTLVKEARITTDGRATQLMQHNAVYHTSKVRYVVVHPAGAQQWFQIFVETFV